MFILDIISFIFYIVAKYNYIVVYVLDINRNQRLKNMRIGRRILFLIVCIVAAFGEVGILEKRERLRLRCGVTSTSIMSLSF